MFRIFTYKLVRKPRGKNSGKVILGGTEYTLLFKFNNNSLSLSRDKQGLFFAYFFVCCFLQFFFLFFVFLLQVSERDNNKKRSRLFFIILSPSLAVSFCFFPFYSTDDIVQARNGLKVGDVTPGLLGAGPQTPTGAGWRTDEGCCCCCCCCCPWAAPITPKFCWWRSSFMLGRGAGVGWNGLGWPAIPEPLNANGLAAGTGLAFVGTCKNEVIIGNSIKAPA